MPKKKTFKTSVKYNAFQKRAKNLWFNGKDSSWLKRCQIEWKRLRENDTELTLFFNAMGTQLEAKNEAARIEAREKLEKEENMITRIF